MRKAFFQDLHAPLMAPNTTALSPTLKVSPQRSFLLRAASAVIQGIPDEPTAESLSPSIAWLSRLFDLARSWGEDPDLVRRHCVCELYSGGHDVLGEEMSYPVKDTVQLASQLLVVAGQRIRHFMFPSGADIPSRIAELTPSVSNWLLNLDTTSLRACTPSPAQILTLLAKVIRWLPEDSFEQRLAFTLQETVERLSSRWDTS